MVEIYIYKDQPIMSLKRDEKDKFGIKFGVNKAKLILSHFEDIKKFVADNQRS